MKRDKRLLGTMAAMAAAAALMMLLFAGAAGALMWSTLTAEEQQGLVQTLGSRMPLVVLAGFAVTGLAAALAPAVYRRWIAAPARLLEQARVLARTPVQKSLNLPDASPDVQGLTEVINELAQQRDQLRADIAAEVAKASLGIEQERSRLAALMSELTQSVVVCNLDGRILLYNNRARVQFRALSDAPTLADGADLIGLGRSIYAVFDRKLVAHALDGLQHRLQRGAANPSAQFVTTTRSGQLLRAQMAAVRTATEGLEASSSLSGFVLMLDNITRDYELESQRERLLHGLTEGSRGSLANLQAALEMLEDEALEPAMRERFLGVVRDEAAAMSRRVQDLAAQTSGNLATRWPLEDMLGSDLLQAAQRRIEAATGLRTGLDEVDGQLWLRLDSFALLQALVYLSQRLRDEFEVSAVFLRLTPADGARARLDLSWAGQAMSTETVMAWELDPMSAGGSDSSAMTVRDVVQRHGAEFWFERDRARHRAFFRFLMPLAPEVANTEGTDSAYLHSDSRPEYYDFNLFSTRDSDHHLDDRRLSELTYTVFDTETTGLNPAGGDQIIQIGATRLVNQRLLKSESFDQLVDPGRKIPEAGIPIHGITDDMVRGKPGIEQVLPAFHRYAADTVLVAHNAAFDMRFLQLKEESTGLKFDQPVLDTLLLSAVVHPNQESHRLEAIAERLDVTVIGRHTALGDAMVTAEVFQKLIPLLAAQGIHTLKQAREAAQQTYYARLKY